MGYPPLPSGPYGPPPPYRPPQVPRVPPQEPPGSPRDAVALVVLLAVGVPLLLLGAGAAVVMVLTDTGRSTPAVEADAPNMVMPSRDPLASPGTGDPAAQPPAADDAAGPPAQARAAVGGTLPLQGADPALRVNATVNRLVNPATPASDLVRPQAGNKLVAVEITLANTGQTAYGDAPAAGAVLIDGAGRQYRSALADVGEGQGFGGSVTVAAGDSRTGVIVFELPEPAQPVTFRFGPSGGPAGQTGEWTLS